MSYFDEFLLEEAAVSRIEYKFDHGCGNKADLRPRKTRYGEELQQLRNDLQTAKAEQEQLRHTLHKTEQQTQRLRADIERTRDTAAQALEQQQQRHNDELATAQTGTPAITESDLKNVQRMVDMLNHLSLDLRNKNRFRDSKEAANRAGVGQRLVDRLFEQRFKALNPPDSLERTPAHPLHSAGTHIEVRKP